MKTKHTQGPWNATVGDDGWFHICKGTEYSVNSFVIATRNPMPSLPGYVRESNANAYLIAASPNLLAALKMVAKSLDDPAPLEHCIAFGPTRAETDDYIKRQVTVGDVVRAALANAKGERT